MEREQPLPGDLVDEGGGAAQEEEEAGEGDRRRVAPHGWSPWLPMQKGKAKAPAPGRSSEDVRARMRAMSVHATAIVSPDARLGRDVSIGPYAVIEDGTVIGDGCEIRAHAVVKRYTRWAPATASTRAPSSAASRRTSPSGSGRPAS